ncbi:hypothetical protein F5B18DRAFT_614443 [Nemania serpens]|nr:hypothetical protein F5B18DRAFT_614443 [Nemania serpens]
MLSFHNPRDFVDWYSCPGHRPLGNAEKIANIDSVCCADRNCSFYDQRYAQSPTAEPLSENMVRLVRSQLSSMFYECIAFSFMCTGEFQHGWRTEMMRRFDQPCLPPEFFATPCPYVRKHLMEYADVHVNFYVESSGDAYNAENYPACRILGRYIFRKWFHWHAGRPPFLSHQRLAKLVGVGGGTRGIQSIRKFHRSLCDAVSTGLNQQELPKQIRSTGLHGPSYSRNLKAYKDQGVGIAHLFRAIFIVVDDQIREHQEPEICSPVFPPELDKPYVLAGFEQWRDWCGSQYSVLLVRTGDDAHLSSPISFQSLFDSGKAFAAQRPDCGEDSSSDDIDVVRVRIDTALEFVLGLIRREREAIPHVGLAAETEDTQHSEACEKWVDSVMAHAGEVGIDMNGFTWKAVRRAKAALNGEAFDEDQVSPLWDHLGSGELPGCDDWSLVGYF